MGLMRLHLAGVACSLAGALLACAPASELPPLPREKTVDEYPGITYPDQGGRAPSFASAAGPVWLVGIDGATWDLILPMVERGELPTFRRLLEVGVHAPLLSEEPMVSPALWTTIATGMPRCVHGVVNFVVKVPSRYRTVSVGPPDRLSPALWELVGAAGGRSVVIGWNGSFPAEEVPGVYVSEGLEAGAPQPGQVEPWTFADRIADGADLDIRAEDRQRIAVTEYLKRTLVGDAEKLAVLRAAVTEVPDAKLVAAYFNGVDVVEHLCWRHMDPASQRFPQDGPPLPELAGVIPAYYRFMDHVLARILSILPPTATLVVVSDHGHGPVGEVEAFHLQLEVLLERLGLMKGSAGEVFAIDELYRHDKTLWLNLEGVEEHGTVPVGAASSTAARVARRLQALRTESGEPLFAAVTNLTTRDSWQPGDPALTVRFATAALLADRVVDGDREIDFWPVRMRHSDVSGDHRLEGVLLMTGPEVRSGLGLEHSTIFQVAPTVLYLLGLPQDARMLAHAPADGGVLEAAIATPALARRPIRMVSGYPGTDRAGLLRTHDPARFPAPPTEAEQLRRLRALGYLR